MEWIIYAFFGVLALVVAGIIGLGLYAAFLGKGAQEKNAGPRMQAKPGDSAEIGSHMDHGSPGGTP